MIPVCIYSTILWTELSGIDDLSINTYGGEMLILCIEYIIYTCFIKRKERVHVPKIGNF